MPERSKSGRSDDLDPVDLVMAIEEAIGVDERLDLAQRDWLIREIEARVERGEFGDLRDLDDDALGTLVRKLGPRPSGEAGAAAQPEEPSSE